MKSVTPMILGITALTLTNHSVNARPVEEKPNIIFVLLDDLGKEWINCYGAENMKTPNIDKLAATGVKFTNAYSMPQCTPSRACFMTGQYPYNNGWVNHWDTPRFGGGYFDWKKNPSIARTMKSAGYTTAATGKWQLNDFRFQPEAMVHHGFDDYCMWTGCEGGSKEHQKMSEKRYWNPYVHTKSGSKVYKDQFGPDIYNAFVLDFISKNKENPFFIYYPMTLPHGPLVHTPHEMDVKSNVDKHKAMVHYADHLLGKLTKHLDTLGIRKNTLIVWTTDNGTTPQFNNIMNGRKVKGGKAKTTENGVNAPFIVNWPGMVPQNKTSEALVDFTDMHKTFADFAGAPPDPQYQYDGYSQKDIFLGKTEKSQRSYILSMGGGTAVLSDKGVENIYYFRDRVIRDQRFKLFIDTDKKPKKFFDLKNDPGEKNDLLKNPEYSAEIERLAAVVKTLPKYDQDPKYIPIAKQPWDRGVAGPSQIHKVGHPDNNGIVLTAKQRKGKGPK